MIENEKVKNDRYNEYIFRSLLEHTDEGIVILSAEGKPLYISPAINKILGYTVEEAMKMDVFSLTHPNDILPLTKIMEKVLANPGVPMKGHTGQMLHKNGTWRWIESTVVNLLDDPAITGIVDNIRDITDKKNEERKLLHANQLYAFISQINQAIVRSANEQELFKEVCRIAVKFGKFKVAWIGIFDHYNKKMSLVEEAGMAPDDRPYFTNIPFGKKGAQDQVLCTGTYYTCNNVQNDLLINDWKPFAQKREYHSIITLPIKKGTEIIGTLNVYATEINFFHEQEIALLKEACGDVSFALDIFEKKAQRLRIEEALRKSESNLHAIIENSDASIYSLDRNLCYIVFNKSLKKSLKDVYDLEINTGDNVYDFLEKIEPLEARAWGKIYAKALLGETVKFEKEFSVGDFYSCISFSIYPIWEDKSIIGLSCFAIDITKQKQDIVQKEKMLADFMQRNKNLEQFSYIVSHNLRAPVANILGLADLLMTKEGIAEEGVLLEGIFNSVKKLDIVVSDLNYVLQVNNQVNENKEIVKFSNLLSDIKLSIDNLLRNEEVEIIADFSAVNEMLTLKSYVYSIFFNLISNSIKYRRPGIKPVIRINTAKDKKNIQLVFTDNGLGIDLVQNADKVFGLYKRFHTHTEGKGVGLYIVKTQVEALAGIITIESEINKGTTFRIVFET